MNESARIAVIGETLIDVVHNADGTILELPGGSPANVAVTLGRLGRRTELFTVLADDDRGQQARRWLEDSHVLVRASDPGTRRTSTAVARLGMDGAAEYDFDLAWDLTAATLTSARDADVLHVGSIATVLPPAADAVEEVVLAARASALVSFDPNARPAITPDREAVLPRVERLVAAADIVKVSDADLAWYYPDSEPLKIAHAWAREGAALVAVTFGGQGSVLLHAGHEIEVAAPQTTVADTIGAGDTYTGALLDALISRGVHGPDARTVLTNLSHEELHSAATWAAATAAVTVSRTGANPPTRAEMLTPNDLEKR